MSLKIRRVVTGHDASGKAVVAIDEISKNVISRRPNHESCVIWTTGEFPADNDGDADDGLRKVGTVDPGGTVFRLVEYGPGVTPRNHRTEFGRLCDRALGRDRDGNGRHHGEAQAGRRAGAARHHPQLDQPGTEPCVVAFVLVAAKPVERAGKLLTAAN